MSKLAPDAVSKLFLACLVSEAELAARYPAGDPEFQTVAGIVTVVLLHRRRVAAAREEIAGLLAELPDEFRSVDNPNGGGGWTFLNACLDRHGNQWTGVHQTMEQLFLLGMAAGLVTELMPRELWSSLPGGMPYYVIDLPEEVSHA